MNEQTHQLNELTHLQSETTWTNTNTDQMAKNHHTTTWLPNADSYISEKTTALPETTSVLPSTPTPTAIIAPDTPVKATLVSSNNSQNNLLDSIVATNDDLQQLASTHTQHLKINHFSHQDEVFVDDATEQMLDSGSLNDIHINNVPSRPTITHIVYESGKTSTISGSTAQAFHLDSLSDSTTISEQTLRDEYQNTYGSNQILANIQAAYDKDSDHDGVVDRSDINPNRWDVSERDLRFFATVAYQDGETLKAAFNNNDNTVINQINNNKSNFYLAADIRELTENWTLLESQSQSTGLDFAIYGNGKKADGSYQNVVVAFRGTKGVTDIMSDVGVGVGKLIDDVNYFETLANNMMSKYQPEKVYTTGHSLGGYLAQYFASHTMQQTAERKTAFQHSAIFNPAKLTTNANNVLDNAEKMYQKTWHDWSDDNNPKTFHKSDSYTIKGDIVGYGDVPKKYVAMGAFATFVSMLFPPLGILTGAATIGMASFKGLGRYSNTVEMEGFSGNSIEKHSKNNFFKQNTKLENIFSKGYRVDKWYENQDTDGDGLTDVQENHLGTAAKSATVLDGRDSDYDGFSDRLEIELGTDFTTAQNAVPLAQERATKFAVAITQNSETGEFINAQGVELTAQMNGQTINYTPNGHTVNLGIASNQEWQTWLNSGSKIQSGGHDNDILSGSDEAQIIYGGDGNDTLIAGSAQTVLVGGNGSDTFQFTASSLLSGSLNIISDFSVEDKLDFSDSQSLFTHTNDFKWTSVLGDESLLAQNDAAIIWQDESHTLAYKAQGSEQLHVFARFDDSQTLATIQAALIA